MITNNYFKLQYSSILEVIAERHDGGWLDDIYTSMLENIDFENEPIFSEFVLGAYLLDRRDVIVCRELMETDNLEQFSAAMFALARLGPSEDVVLELINRVSDDEPDWSAAIMESLACLEFKFNGAVSDELIKMRKSLKDEFLLMLVREYLDNRVW